MVYDVTIEATKHAKNNKFTQKTFAGFCFAVLTVQCSFIRAKSNIFIFYHVVLIEIYLLHVNYFKVKVNIYVKNGIYCENTRCQ